MSEAEILWERALGPPMSLVDYRQVMAGADPANENQRQLLSVFRDKPAQFRTEWRAEEKAYREALAKMIAAKGKPASDSPAADESPGDEGAARASELLDRLLGEAGS